MQSVGDAKTKSAPKESIERNPGFSQRAGTRSKFPSRAALFLTVVGGCLVIILVAIFFYSFGSSTTELKAGGHTYTLQVAQSEKVKEKGLGGRTSLPTDQGMLFTYSRPQKLCFWMKDMRFPLDMIWVDGNKQVVAIEPDINPNTYPQVYCSTAQYVVELNAGQAAASRLHTGQQLSF